MTCPAPLMSVTLDRNRREKCGSVICVLSALVVMLGHSTAAAQRWRLLTNRLPFGARVC